MLVVAASVDAIRKSNYTGAQTGIE